jgi:hypothetical protein
MILIPSSRPRILITTGKASYRQKDSNDLIITIITIIIIFVIVFSAQTIAIAQRKKINAPLLQDSK